jgi:hypothetical protein
VTSMKLVVLSRWRLMDPVVRSSMRGRWYQSGRWAIVLGRWANVFSSPSCSLLRKNSRFATGGITRDNPHQDDRQRPCLPARCRASVAARTFPPGNHRPHRNKSRLRYEPVRLVHRARERHCHRNRARGWPCRPTAPRLPPSRGSRPTASSHALQESFWNKHGLQCGFCTPGMIMASADLLKQEPQADA